MNECAAPRCNRPLPEGIHMCRRHWFGVPGGLRDEVDFTYKESVKSGDHPTPEFSIILQAAIDAVAEKGKP